MRKLILAHRRLSVLRQPDRVTIYDTTLRDGCQGAGISRSLHDKLSIARKLDEFGVDFS